MPGTTYFMFSRVSYDLADDQLAALFLEETLNLITPLVI
jgi:hypothetical protein